MNYSVLAQESQSENIMAATKLKKMVGSKYNVL